MYRRMDILFHFKNLLMFVRRVQIQNLLSANLCVKVNLHIALLCSCANKMAALARLDTKQESNCRKDW